MSDGIHDDKDQVSDEQGRDPFTDEQEEKPSGDPFSVTEDAVQDAAEPGAPEDGSQASEGEGQKTEDGSSESEDGSQTPGSSASGLESAHGAGEEEENPSASQAEDSGKTQEQAVQEPPEEHDFDDEPKFDTQTGEPLSKPKSKVPGILLTFAVTAGVVGAISAAVFNRDKWRSEGTEDHAQVETEARLQVAQETEAQADTEPSSEKAPLITPASGSGETEASETEQTNAAETEKGAQKSEKKGAESEESLAGKLGKNAVSLNTSLDVSDVAGRHFLPWFPSPAIG